MSPRKFISADGLFAVGGSLLLWGILFAAIPPSRQEFPLNDDWAYSKGAFAFSRGEGIQYFRQPSMPLLGQWFLTYPIIIVFGESHVALRVLTITLGLFGVMAFRDLLRREVGVSARNAGFAAAALALNPIYFLVSGTYMSDVPALALSLLALDFYTRALRSHHLGWLAAATIAASLGVLTRQNAIISPVVSGFLLWGNRRLRWRPAWLFGIWMPVIVGILAHIWFSSRSDTVPLAPRIPTPSDVFGILFACTHYLGLSAMPLLVLRPRVGWKLFFIAFGVMLDGAAICLMFGDQIFLPNAYHGGLFPYCENIVTPWGTLESNNYVVGHRHLMMGHGLQILLSLGGCVCGAAIFALGIGRLQGARLASPLLLFTILHSILILISPNLYDRYLVVLMPGVIALVVGTPGRIHLPAGVFALVLFAACSLGLMHDWLQWNSARWELGRRALSRGISSADIEGGLEWDGWYSPYPVAPPGPMLPSRGLMLPFNRQRFPHITGRYALSFSPVDKVDVIDSQPYQMWLVPGLNYFLLLKQRPDDEP